MGLEHSKHPSLLNSGLLKYNSNMKDESGCVTYLNALNYDLFIAVNISII